MVSQAIGATVAAFHNEYNNYTQDSAAYELALTESQKPAEQRVESWEKQLTDVKVMYVLSQIRAISFGFMSLAAVSFVTIALPALASGSIFALITGLFIFTLGHETWKLAENIEEFAKKEKVSLSFEYSEEEGLFKGITEMLMKNGVILAAAVANKFEPKGSTEEMMANCKMILSSLTKDLYLEGTIHYFAESYMQKFVSENGRLMAQAKELSLSLGGSTSEPSPVVTQALATFGLKPEDLQALMSNPNFNGIDFSDPKALVANKEALTAALLELSKNRFEQESNENL